MRAWSIRRGTLAPKAAGVIHTDFEKGFICAEVMTFKDLEEAGGDESKVRAAGKLMQKVRILLETVKTSNPSKMLGRGGTTSSRMVSSLTSSLITNFVIRTSCCHRIHARVLLLTLAVARMYMLRLLVVRCTRRRLLLCL